MTNKTINIAHPPKKNDFFSTSRKSNTTASSGSFVSSDGIPNNLRQKCEVWTRVMGYHRPKSQFNKGKQSEFHERAYFTVPAEL